MPPKNAAAAEAPEPNETEKGFGTGLRAKVAQKQDPAAAQAAEEPVAPPVAEAPPQPPVSFDEPPVSPPLERRAGAGRPGPRPGVAPLGAHGRARARA